METLFGMFPFLKTLFADSGYQGPSGAGFGPSYKYAPAVAPIKLESAATIKMTHQRLLGSGSTLGRAYGQR
jgi:hypothetical protein